MNHKYNGKLRLWYANLDNSILSKIGEIRIKATEENPDIMMFNEIKPKNGKIYDIRTLQIEGYDLYINDINNASTRGVCIYINSTYKSSEVIVKDHNFKDVVSVSVTVARKKNILVQCIYRSGTVKTAIANDPDMHKLFNMHTC